MIDIHKIVETNFTVVKSPTSLGSYNKVLFVSKTEASADTTSIFEKCGGSPENLVKVISDVSTLKSDILSRKKADSGTDDDFIFVCFDQALSTALLGQVAVLQELCAFDSPYKIIPCLSKQGQLSLTEITALSTMPVAVKLSADDGASLAIAAYYSEINLDRAQSLQDYCYTPEAELSEFSSADAVYESHKDIANFVATVGNSKVNIGGNLTNQVAITAQFGAIAVENDIIRAVANTMLRKQYLTDEGLNNIVSAINSAMTRYTFNGLLQTNSVYTGETFVDNYTNSRTPLIKHGVILPEGYYVAKLPMSKLNNEDRRSRKFPPIHVFMQTQSGARVVSIDGTVVD